MKRRNFLKKSTLSAITAFAGSSFISNGCSKEEDMMMTGPTTIKEGNFDRPLSYPPVVSSNVKLTAQSVSGKIVSNDTTSFLSYREGVLGPTIKVNKGESVNIQFQNNLPEQSNIHFHGLITPEEMDGHPKDVVATGNSFNYVFPIKQRAGTYWYHPHPDMNTAKQVFMGLAGLFIVNDTEEAALNLPSGENEIHLIIQDKRFSGTSLNYSPTADEIMSGYFGEQILVNGIASPYASLNKGWNRIRIVNGSTARLYDLALSNNKPFYIIGSDGGLLSKPESVTSILIAPGERADILVDFSALAIGQELFLVSNKFGQPKQQGNQAFNIIKLKVDRTSSGSFTLPASLSSITPVSTSSAIRKRTFDIGAMMSGMHGGMGRHAINGKTFEMERVDETVKAGTSEIWEFDNSMGDEIHPMHIHGVHFQIVQRTGGRNEIIATEKGWKDTVLLMPGEKVQVIMTFSEYTGMFVFHCHNLEHEDDGMMLNYKII